MINRFLLLLSVSLIGEHLLAQCNSCDSQMIAKGYHILTSEEKKNDPTLADRSATYYCDRNCKLVIEQPPRPVFQFDGKWGYISLRTGANFNHLKTDGLNLAGYKYTSAPQPYLSIAFDLDAPEWDGFCIRAEVDWKRHNFRGVRENENRVFNRREIKLTGIGQEISLFYKYPKGTFRWFVGVGGGRESIRVRQNTLTDYYSQGKPFTVNDTESIGRSNPYLSLSCGVMLKDRLEIRYKFLYAAWQSCDPGQALYNLQNISNIITVGYRFL